MKLLIKTPFNSNKLETDPEAYGLRETIIKLAIVELFNDRSLLITGVRGIGKSSLSYQLQNILNGDDTLLKRCQLNIKLPYYITIDYVCSRYDTLENVVLGIIDELEKKLDVFESKFRVKNAIIDLSFGIFKGNIEFEKRDEKKYNTLIKSFLDTIIKLSDIYVDLHINIAIDELDQLDMKYNVAHFIKIVLETLNRKNLSILSFILVGQSCTLGMLLEQQPAIHRLVKHIDLKPLEYEDSEYVLESCLRKSKISTHIQDKASKFLLAFSSGYPYSIHILGHETYNSMLDRYTGKPVELIIVYDDVVKGIKNVLLNNNERYDQIYSLLDSKEKSIIRVMAYEHQENIPMLYSKELIYKKVQETFSDIIQESEFEEILQLLCNKQILTEVPIKTKIGLLTQELQYKFNEELFRVFLNWSLNNSRTIDYGMYE